MKGDCSFPNKGRWKMENKEKLQQENTSVNEGPCLCLTLIVAVSAAVLALIGWAETGNWYTFIFAGCAVLCFTGYGDPYCVTVRQKICAIAFMVSLVLLWWSMHY